MLRRWYFLDDDIESFYEYDNRLGHRIMTKNKNSAFKALNFMRIVLEDSISNDDNIRQISNHKFLDWSIDIAPLVKNNPLYKELYDILFNKKLGESKNVALDLINRLLDQQINDLPALLSIKEDLLNKKSKIIGQVALSDKLSHFSDYENRLQGEKPNK